MDCSGKAYGPPSRAAPKVVGALSRPDVSRLPMPVLTGTACDVDGEPLRGIHVKALRDDALVGWCETDCNGHFEIPVSVGTYTLVFCSTAYHEVREAGVLVAGPSTRVDAELMLIF